MDKTQNLETNEEKKTSLDVASQQEKSTAKVVARKKNSSIPESTKPMTLTSTSILGTRAVRCTVKRGSNFAPLDQDGNRYVSRITFDSRKKFSLEATIITSGPFKGQSAIVIVPVPRNTFPFLDLPPEIRNMIYRLALTHEDDDVRITGKKGNNLRAVWITKKGKRTRGIVRGRDVSPDTSLLSVCKQMHMEAGTIFYACNRFHLSNTSALYFFLEKIGVLGKRIQHLTITDLTDTAFWPTRTEGAGKLLAEAEELQHIRINCDGLNDEKTKRLVGMFAPLVEMLYKRGEDQAQIFTVIDIRKGSHACFHHGASYSWGRKSQGCTDCDHAKRRAERAMAELEYKTYKATERKVQKAIKRKACKAYKAMKDKTHKTTKHQVENDDDNGGSSNADASEESDSDESGDTDDSNNQDDSSGSESDDPDPEHHDSGS